VHPPSENLILITLLVELGVAAAVASSLARSVTFKRLLLDSHRSQRDSLKMLAMVCVPLMLGVWIRVRVPNFLAADLSFEATILLALVMGPALGVKFGYHNHVREFLETDGKTPYVELLGLTDPQKVTFELDCGWAVAAGKNPIELLREHPHRISLLHVKDFKMGTPAGEGHEPQVTELGRGSIDYRPIFAQAAKTQKIQHAFVEQEAFDIPWKDSLKVDAEYMRKLSI